MRAITCRVFGLPAGLALAALVAGTACGDPRIFVQARPGLAARPATVDLVIVSREPAPRRAKPMGEVAFLSHVSNLPEALRRVRARARRIGGNLVAPLLCRPARRYRDGGRLDFTRSERLLPGDRLQCYGKVYRVD